MYSLLGFLITIGILVTFHELGHYWVARWCGVKVLRFSFGFGPVLFSRKRGLDQTEWALSALPLGGYVRMLDERDGEPVAETDLPRAFNRQSVGKRFAIVAAGPLANLLLAVILLSATYMAGVPGYQAVLSSPAAETAAADAGLQLLDRIVAVDGEPVAVWRDVNWRVLNGEGSSVLTLTVERNGHRMTVPLMQESALKKDDGEGQILSQLGLRPYLGAPLIREVLPGSPAAAAGMQAGDRIRAVNGDAVHAPSEMIEKIANSGEAPVMLSVLRQGSTVMLTVTPRLEEGKDGKKIGRIGVSVTNDPETRERYTMVVRHGPFDAIALSVARTWELTALSFKMIGRMLIGNASLKNLSGPLTIADYAGQSVQAGFQQFLSYLAMISIGLGVLNLLPVPLLDGGHLLYYSAEIVRGRPLPERVIEIGQRIGLALIITLIALALLNDFSRLF